MLEVARILYSRGHTIELATLAGNEGWAAECDFVAKTYTLGPGVPEDVEEREYLAMSAWENSRYTTDYSAMFRSRRFMAQSWPDVYKSLCVIVEDENTRPDLLLADYGVVCHCLFQAAGHVLTCVTNTGCRTRYDDSVRLTYRLALQSDADKHVVCKLHSRDPRLAVRDTDQ